MQVDALPAHEEGHTLEQDGPSVIGRKGQGREPREDTDHELEGTNEPRRKPGGQRDERSGEGHGGHDPADQAQVWVKERSPT